MTGDERFVGVYDLVSLSRSYADGRHVDLPSVGRTSYDAAGRMWVLLAPRSHAEDGGRRHGVMGGTVAYCGSYEIDEAARTICHRVEIALDPSWVGRAMVREYEFVCGELRLTTRTSAYTLQARYRPIAGISRPHADVRDMATAGR